MDLTEALVRGWRIFRADRGIWILGMLTALFGQGEFSSSFNGSFNQTSPIDPGAPEPELPPFFESQQFQDLIANPWPLIGAVIAISLLFSVVLAVIGIWMKSALIHRTSITGQEQRAPLGASFRRGGERLPKSLLLELTLALPTLLMSLVVIGLAAVILVQGLSMIGADRDPGGMIAGIFGALICLIPIALVMVVFSLVISLIEPFALRSCVLDDTGVRASISLAWRLIRANIAITLVNWFILGALAFIVGLAIALPTIFFVATAAERIFSGGFEALPLLFGGLLMYGILFGTLVGGLLTGYRAVVWTEVYRFCRSSAV